MPLGVLKLAESTVLTIASGIGGAGMWLLGIKLKNDREFKKHVYKRMDKIHNDVQEKHEYILKNYPDKDDIDRLHATVIDGFKDIKKEMRSRDV